MFGFVFFWVFVLLLLFAGQMFKLVQSTGKPISGIMTSALAAGQPLKIIKTVAAGGQDQQQQQQQQVGLF